MQTKVKEIFRNPENYSNKEDSEKNTEEDSKEIMSENHQRCISKENYLKEQIELLKENNKLMNEKIELINRIHELEKNTAPPASGASGAQTGTDT